MAVGFTHVSLLQARPRIEKSAIHANTPYPVPIHTKFTQSASQSRAHIRRELFVEVRCSQKRSDRLGLMMHT